MVKNIMGIKAALRKWRNEDQNIGDLLHMGYRGYRTHPNSIQFSKSQSEFQRYIRQDPASQDHIQIEKELC